MYIGIDAEIVLRAPEAVRHLLNDLWKYNHVYIISSNFVSDEEKLAKYHIYKGPHFLSAWNSEPLDMYVGSREDIGSEVTLWLRD